MSLHLSTIFYTHIFSLNFMIAFWSIYKKVTTIIVIYDLKVRILQNELKVKNVQLRIWASLNLKRRARKLGISRKTVYEIYLRFRCGPANSCQWQMSSQYPDSPKFDIRVINYPWNKNKIWLTFKPCFGWLILFNDLTFGSDSNNFYCQTLTLGYDFNLNY